MVRGLSRRVLATAALGTLMKGRGPVHCEPKDMDRYGRAVAICRVDGRDLSEAMVQLGMAWAFTRYSGDYIEQEASARTKRLGVRYMLTTACRPGNGERS